MSTACNRINPANNKPTQYLLPSLTVDIFIFFGIKLGGGINSTLVSMGFASVVDSCKLVTRAPPPTPSEATMLVPVCSTALSLPTKSLVSTSNDAGWTPSTNLRPDLVMSLVTALAVPGTPVVWPLENEHLLCGVEKTRVQNGQ